MKRIIFSILVLTSLFYHLSASGQGKVYTVRVFDQLTSESIWDVEIYLDDSIVTKSNSKGLFQVNTVPGNVLVLKHKKYKSGQITLPDKYKFNVPLEVKTREISYDGGFVNFYNNLVASINNNLDDIPKDKSKVIFVEFEIVPGGKCVMTKIYNDDNNDIGKLLATIFGNLPGKWDPKYSGKKMLMPFQLDFDAPDSSDYSQLAFTQTDKILDSIIITEYGALYNENTFVNRKEE